METNTTKRCPFCGEEIKSTAIKCKHCGEFLESKDSPTQLQTKIKWKSILKWVAVIYGFAILIALVVPPTQTEMSDNSVDTNIEANDANENSSYNDETTSYDENIITGSFSGFGKWAVATANYGGQLANCQHKGVGVSLVEQIEYFFDNVSEYKRPEFYRIKQQNPNLRFLVTNPVWTENATFMNACKADVQFENISEDTIMGYSGGQPYYADNAYCKITYTVSEQGNKYKANVINMFCTPSDGYR